MFIIDSNNLVIQSSILGTPIEFKLEHLYHILKLSNEGDKCYITTYDDQLVFGRSEEKFILLSLTPL